MGQQEFENFDEGDDLIIYFCYSCFKFMGIVEDTFELELDDDFITDNSGVLFSKHICEDCKETIKEHDVFEEVNNTMEIEEEELPEKELSDMTIDDFIKNPIAKLPKKNKRKNKNKGK